MLISLAVMDVCGRRQEDEGPHPNAREEHGPGTVVSQLFDYIPAEYGYTWQVQGGTYLGLLG